ncbi:MAG: hypothetical protein GWP10_15565 [Nitrospiraceae bacterium]|nr:hypothetical protein [Nitrospiraceae bacterium]
MIHIVQNIIAIFFILAGLFFFTTSIIGLIRFPDFYCRMHATGKGDTLGTILLFAGFIVYEGVTLTSLKLLLIPVFIFLASPTVTHSIGKAAVSCCAKGWEKEKSKEEGANA